MDKLITIYDAFDVIREKAREYADVKCEYYQFSSGIELHGYAIHQGADISVNDKREYIGSIYSYYEDRLASIRSEVNEALDFIRKIIDEE